MTQLDLESIQWNSTRFDEYEICNFLRNEKLLDITKYFYNASSIVLPTDYRTLKDIYTSYFNTTSMSNCRSYNDDFLDYINANSGKPSDTYPINTGKIVLTDDAALSCLNEVDRRRYMSYRCGITKDIALAEKLCWSDESDEERDDLSQSSKDNLEINMAAIGYNAVLKCISDNRSTSYLTQLIKKQDLISMLQGKVRSSIYNGSDFIGSVLFVDNMGLTRLINFYCFSKFMILLSAHVTIVDGIMIDKMFDINNSYIVCFVDAISLGNSKPSKLIVILDSSISGIGFDKNNNYYWIYYLQLDSDFRLSYFSHGETGKFDILTVKSSLETICIPFSPNNIVKPWIQQWLNNCEIGGVLDLDSELIATLDDFIKSLHSVDKYLVCILPISLSDLTLYDERFEWAASSNDTSMHNAIELVSSRVKDPNVKHILESFVYKDSKFLYNNLIGTEKINNHVNVDSDLFNLIDQEIANYNL